MFIVLIYIGWNVKMLNRTGKPYKGHFNLSLMAELQQVADRVFKIYPHPNPLLGWVNGQLYVQTKEQFGIAITPNSVFIEFGMETYNPLQVSLMQFQFLAQQQNTCFAITMVCYEAEKHLFTQFKKDNHPAFVKGHFHWAALVWNAHANGKDIFYKVVTLMVS
jgi:hypothetical protein